MFFRGLRYRDFVDSAAAAMIITAPLAIRLGNRQVYPKPDTPVVCRNGGFVPRAVDHYAVIAR